MIFQQINCQLLVAKIISETYCKKFDTHLYFKKLHNLLIFLLDLKVGKYHTLDLMKWLSNQTEFHMNMSYQFVIRH